MKNRGFTLIETAMIMVILGFIIAALIKTIPVMVAQEQERQQEKSYDTVRAALNSFITREDPSAPGTLTARFPCPAPLNKGPGDLGFAVEQWDDGADPDPAANDDTCDTSAGSGVFAINDGGGNLVGYAGAIPTNTLGISSEHMLDPYKRKITYAVSLNMIQRKAIDRGLEGQITIEDETGNPFTNTAQFALISHGQDGAGAYSLEGGEALPCRGGAAADGQNCDFTDASSVTAHIFRDSQAKLGNSTDFYDDRLAFSLVDDEDDEWWESVDGINDIRNKNTGIICVGDDCDPTMAAGNDRLVVEGSVRVTSSMDAAGHLNIGGSATIGDDAVVGRDVTAVRDVLAGQDVSATNNVIAGNLLSGGQGGVIGVFDANTLNGNSLGVQHDITAGRDIFGRDLNASRGLRVGENPSDNGSMGIDGDSWFRGALNIDSDKDGSWGSIYNGSSTEGLVLSGKWHDWQGTPREDLVIHENGRVGIGISTPTAALDVNGKVKVRGGLDIDSDTDGSWGSIFNSVETEGLAFSGKHTGIAREDIVISENGNVGIGKSTPEAKLDVNGDMRMTGGLKVGFDGNNCRAGNEGVQRYNPAAKEMEFCDGFEWRPVSANLSVITVEERLCTRQGVHSVNAVCPAGYRLLSCTGGAGDVYESREYWTIVPDYENHRCYGNVGEPAFFGPLNSCTRVFAACYRAVSGASAVPTPPTGLPVNAVTGQCGAANGAVVTAAPPASSLCTVGTPTGLAGSGPWTWQCNGLNGGSAVNCQTSAPATNVSHGSCRWKNIVKPAKTIECGSNEFMAGLGLEGATWSNDADNHAAPEVYRIKCCTLNVH